MAVFLLNAFLGFVFWIGFGAIAASDEPQNPDIAQSSALKLLAVGFEPRIVQMEELERLYEVEKSRVPDGSPYLEYAFALVLSRNLQPEQAEKHLQAAVKSRSPILLPAHEELIRQAIAASDYQATLEMLAEYACLINEIPSEHGDAAEAHRAASWLGCVIAYLEGPADIPDEMEALSKLTGKQLKLLLDQSYIKDYEAGRQAVKDRHADIKKQLNEAMTQSVSKNSRTDIQTRL